MKTLNLKLTLAAIAAFWALLGSGGVFAQTAAELTISNSATLSFNTGGLSDIQIISTPTGNSDIVGGSGTNAAGLPTDFEVDRVIDFTVSNLGADWNDGGTASVGQDDVIIGFDITNNSNGPLDFALVAVVDDADINDTPTGFSSGAGFTAATTAWASGITATILVDDPLSANDTYDVGVDVDAFVDELAAGDTRRIYVFLDIPATAIQGETAPVSIVAQAAGSINGTTGDYSATDGSLAAIIDEDSNGSNSPGGAGAVSSIDDPDVVQNVFAEDLNLVAGEEGASDATAFTAANFDASGTLVFAANDGQFGASSGVWINGVELTVSKAVHVIWDPYNANTNPKAVPGAYLRYVITILNSGGSTASLTNLVDSIAAVTTELDFDDGGLLTLGCTTVGLVPAGTCLSHSGATYTASTDDLVAILDVDNDIATGATATYQPLGTDQAFYSTTGIDLPVADSITAALATLLDYDGSSPADYILETDGNLQAGDSVHVIFNVILQ